MMFFLGRGARTREADHHSLPFLPTMALAARRGVGMAGPCCGEVGKAGDPCAPVLGGEDGA
jgi:hypothetical protein